MASSDEINKMLKERRKEKGKVKKTDNRGYLVCDNCGGYYELQTGESPSDFDECQCGGKLKHVKNLGDTEEESKDTNSSDKSTSGNILDIWNKQKIITKIIGVASLIVILAVAGLYISHITTPTFEDNLIKSYESGVSQANLLSTVENYYNSVKDNLNARKRADISLVNNRVATGEISPTEQAKELNNINNKYQTELANLDAIKALQIAYINNLSSAKDLITSTNALYQQSPDLNQLRRVD